MLLLILFAAALATPAQAGILISIDKSAQRMSVSVDGVRRFTWPVSTGRAGYATPAGTFIPFRMEADHVSKEWDEAPMPHAIFFTRQGHAIHGTYETRRLGRAASHGCVRLAPAHAARLFALVKAEGLGNAKVVVSGGTPAVAKRRVPRSTAPQSEPPDAAWAPDMAPEPVPGHVYGGFYRSY
jgi:hypothetical protein